MNLTARNYCEIKTTSVNIVSNISWNKFIAVNCLSSAGVTVKSLLQSSQNFPGHNVYIFPELVTSDCAKVRFKRKDTRVPYKHHRVTPFIYTKKTENQSLFCRRALNTVKTVFSFLDSETKSCLFHWNGSEWLSKRTQWSKIFETLIFFTDSKTQVSYKCLCLCLNKCKHVRSLFPPSNNAIGLTIKSNLYWILHCITPWFFMYDILLDISFGNDTKFLSLAWLQVFNTNLLDILDFYTCLLMILTKFYAVFITV